MRKNVRTSKKLELFCFGLSSDNNHIRKILLNGYDFDDIFRLYFSKMELSNPENMQKTEAFITGLSNCVLAFDKDISFSLEFMLQPYKFINFEKELKSVQDIVEFYIFTGERIYDLTNSSKGIIKLDI